MFAAIAAAAAADGTAVVSLCVIPVHGPAVS